MPTRNYSSVARRDIKLTDVTAVADTLISVTIPVTGSNNLPEPPFLLALDRGKPSEELVLATAVSAVPEGSAYADYVVTRGVDGTAAVEHQVGATVEHVTAALDVREAQQRLDVLEADKVSNKGSSAERENVITASDPFRPALGLQGHPDQTYGTVFYVKNGAGQTVASALVDGRIQGKSLSAQGGGVSTSGSAAADAIYANAAGYKGLVVRGGETQAVDLAQFQNYSGVVLANVSAAGRGGFTGLTTTAATASTIPLEIKAVAGQTASLVDIRNSAGQLLLSVGGTGQLNVGVINASQAASQYLFLGVSGWPDAGILSVVNPSTTKAAAIIKSGGGSATLLEFHSTTGAVLGGVTQSGRLLVATSNTVATAGALVTYMFVTMTDGTIRKIPLYAA